MNVMNPAIIWWDDQDGNDSCCVYFENTNDNILRFRRPECHETRHFCERGQGNKKLQALAHTYTITAFST